MEGDYLFVYGSLRPAARFTSSIVGADKARALLTKDRHETAATVPGHLLSLGLYPGWVAPGGLPGTSSYSHVQGDIYRVNDRILACLDVYEGCSASCPQPHEYRRCKVIAVTAEGSEIEVWVYEYIGHLTGMIRRIELIPSNDWLKM